MSPNHHLKASNLSYAMVIKLKKEFQVQDRLQNNSMERTAMEITLKITRVPLSGPWATLPS